MPALNSAFATATPQFLTSGAGFRITVLPAARAASTPPIGIATGKFQGGTTSVNLSGENFASLLFTSSGIRLA